VSQHCILTLMLPWLASSTAYLCMLQCSMQQLACTQYACDEHVLCLLHMAAPWHSIQSAAVQPSCCSGPAYPMCAGHTHILRCTHSALAHMPDPLLLLLCPGLWVMCCPCCTAARTMAAADGRTCEAHCVNLVASCCLSTCYMGSVRGSFRKKYGLAVSGMVWGLGWQGPSAGPSVGPSAGPSVGPSVGPSAGPWAAMRAAHLCVQEEVSVAGQQS
jgi:hypothetical protein